MQVCTFTSIVPARYAACAIIHRRVDGFHHSATVKAASTPEAISHNDDPSDPDNESIVGDPESRRKI